MGPAESASSHGESLQAAANISVVRGSLSAERAAAMSSRGRGVEAGQPYSAAALSLVFHPAHPMVPTLRADVRLFEASAIMRPDICNCCLGHLLW